MLLLIGIEMEEKTYVLNSNTSHVIVNRRQIGNSNVQAGIQIHLMLLLIFDSPIKNVLCSAIQIHLMLLLIEFHSQKER